MRITRTLTTAIAIAALAAPAAQARPADPAQSDMHASVAIAAQQHATSRPLGHAGDADFRPPQTVSDSQPVTDAPVAVADDGGASWTSIAFAAAGLLVAAGIAAAAVRRSPRVRVNV